MHITYRARYKDAEALRRQYEGQTASVDIGNGSVHAAAVNWCGDRARHDRSTENETSKATKKKSIKMTRSIRENLPLNLLVNRSATLKIGYSFARRQLHEFMVLGNAAVAVGVVVYVTHSTHTRAARRNAEKAAKIERTNARQINFSV